jgi:hypothetical protein
MKEPELISCLAALAEVLLYSWWTNPRFHCFHYVWTICTRHRKNTINFQYISRSEQNKTLHPLNLSDLQRQLVLISKVKIMSTWVKKCIKVKIGWTFWSIRYYCTCTYFSGIPILVTSVFGSLCSFKNTSRISTNINLPFFIHYILSVTLALIQDCVNKSALLLRVLKYECANVSTITVLHLTIFHHFLTKKSYIYHFRQSLSVYSKWLWNG